MYFKHKKLIQKICKGICTMAVFAAPVASEYCHVLFYQPKEPEGFKEFLNIMAQLSRQKFDVFIMN